jgi:uncharacterized membrane protein YphA (DoxX/SURF4 family)
MNRSRFSLRSLCTIFVGSVWIFHGLYSKILNGIPRHRAIVGRVLGDEWATPMTMAVGILEITLGLWALSGWRRRECALVQTLAIVTMNSLEIARARDLLLSAPGMLLLNATFLVLVWHWALAPGSGSER